MGNYTFKNKSVLLTGATGGLGRELANLLSREGANLILTGRNFSILQDFIASLPLPEAAIALDADLTKPGEAKRLAKEALRVHGYIDVLINNAGMGYFALVEEATNERIRQLFELNTFSPLTLAKEILPSMQNRAKGRIITIASSAGRVPIPTVGIYGSSKSALAIMTNTLRLELASTDVKVITIYPGTIASAFEVNALREKKRPGLGIGHYRGKPAHATAKEVIDAARGPAGEVWLEREGRWMAATAIFWPKLVDKRLIPLRDRLIGTETQPSSGKRRWRLWQVESSIACNLKCIMCPWTTFRKNMSDQELMPDKVWRSIIPYLSEVESVDFTGGGEPLMLPSLAERIAEAKSEGCRTGFLTNGMLFTREMCDRILSAGIDWIGFSVDGADEDSYRRIRKGATFEMVISHIKYLVTMQIGKVPRIMINFVMMHDNFHQVTDMVKLAHDLGVNQVNFKQCDVIRGKHSNRGIFAKKTDKEIRHFKRELNRALKLARRLRIDTSTFSFTPDELPVCDQDPRHSLFVRYDGKVAPCINQAYGGETCFLGNTVIMPSVHYGSLPDATPLDLWESETCRFYRKRFEERDSVYNKKFMDTMMESSFPDIKRTTDNARNAMPEPPQGCESCHYLFDI